MAGIPSMKAPPLPVGTTLKLMALKAVELISKRAFPDAGQTTRSTTGVAARKLSPGYAAWKAKRLGIPAVANQRLTNETAKALGILTESDSRVVIGFATESARHKAENLQDRNAFWPLAKREEKTVLDIAREAGHKFAKSVKITGGTVRIELR